MLYRTKIPWLNMFYPGTHKLSKHSWITQDGRLVAASAKFTENTAMGSDFLVHEKLKKNKKTDFP